MAAESEETLTEEPALNAEEAVEEKEEKATEENIGA